MKFNSAWLAEARSAKAAALVVALLTPTLAAASERRAAVNVVDAVAVPAHSPIVLDGKFNEEVWQQAPPVEAFFNWGGSSHYCADLTLGNRRGWRLPTMQELATLTDASQVNPTLAAGHPFVNVDLEHPYWSSTVTSADPSLVWTLSMATGKVGQAERCAGGGCGAPKTPPTVWCVRGGSGSDVQ